MDFSLFPLLNLKELSLLYASCPVFFSFLFSITIRFVNPPFPFRDLGFQARSYVYSIIRYMCSRECMCEETIGLGFANHTVNRRVTC